VLSTPTIVAHVTQVTDRTDRGAHDAYLFCHSSNLRSMIMRTLYLLATLAFTGLVPSGAARAEALETAEASYREADVTYATEAVVEATRQSTISAQTTGRVVELRFDVGDSVRQGEVIARIDPQQLEQALAGSVAQVAQARAAYENARTELDRTRELARQKFVSQAALDRAEAAFRVAEAGWKAAQASAGQASTSRSYTTVLAPYSGVVSARHVELGEMASPGKPLLTGFDPADLRVVAVVPQYRVAAVRAGAKASVEIPSLGRWIEGKSVTVLPSADSQSHVTRVRIDLPRDVRDIYPGVFARAHFAIGRERRLVIPSRSVLRRSEVTAVYVISTEGLPKLRQIRAGESAGPALIEVLAGVQPGEKVALDPVRAGMVVAAGARQGRK